MKAKHLCVMLHVRKGDASLFGTLINHVTSHINALQTFFLHVPIHDLMLNYLMLATLDPETQREWELITSSRAITSTTADIATFLGSRCRFLELLQTTKLMKIFPNILRISQSTGNKVSKSYSNLATQLQNSMCNYSHRLFKCENFIKMQSKQ